MIRFFVLFLFIVLKSFSQKAEIVLKSGYSHNYALGYCYYVEDKIDTSKLFFVGIVKITSSNLDAHVVGATHLLKAKTKELNGNTYKLKSVLKLDTSLVMLFDIYFAPENQISSIKAARLKDQIIVFNNIKDTLTRRLNINDSMYSFNRSKYLVIYTKNKNVKIKIDSGKVVRYNDKIKPGQTAEFITVKVNNSSKAILYTTAIATGGMIGFVAASTTESLINKQIIPSFEYLSNINYNTGRILMSIYQKDRQITLD
jgi:hypothetical protein